MERICKNCKWWTRNAPDNKIASTFAQDTLEEEIISIFEKDTTLGVCNLVDFLLFTRETHICEAWEPKVDAD